MRDAFVDELCFMAQNDPSIVLVVGDLGYSVLDKFVKNFPRRFFNAGVAEQSMMSLSAGLASEGHRVFVYSIANFPTFRCAEQIRNDVDYHNLPVTIVAVGGGVSYGNLGYSHHAVGIGERRLPASIQCGYHPPTNTHNVGRLGHASSSAHIRQPTVPLSGKPHWARVPWPHHRPKRSAPHACHR